MKKTLKTLLLSLAFSDFGVGLFAQPFQTSLAVTLNRIMNISGSVFSTISFLGVVAVSVDRFLAVQLHLRYQELVTHKRVVVVVIFIWVFKAFVYLMILWESPVTRDFLISFTSPSWKVNSSVRQGMLIQCSLGGMRKNDMRSKLSDTGWRRKTPLIWIRMIRYVIYTCHCWKIDNDTNYADFSTFKDNQILVLCIQNESKITPTCIL